MKNKFLIPLYLLKEPFTPILILFIILSILVFCQQISRNSELIFSSIINWEISVKILLSLLPPVFTFTLPVAIVLGEILAISRLAADSEWFALETSALSYLPRIMPFLFYGVVGFLLLLALNWDIGPQSSARIKSIRNNLSFDQVAAQIQPQTFITQFPNHLLRIRSVNRTSGTWEGVLLLKKGAEDNKIQLLAARSGSLTPLNQSFTAFEIKLSDGVYIDNLLSTENHLTSAFKGNTIRVSTMPQETKADSVSAITTNTPTQASFTEMGALFSRLKLTQDVSAREIELEIFKRLTNAFACIYAAFTALVLAAGFRPRSSKRTLLIFTSFLLMIIYYTSLAFGQNLAIKVSGKQGTLLGCLIPSLVLLIVYLILSTNKFKALTRAIQSLAAGTVTLAQRNSTLEIKASDFNSDFAPRFPALPRINLGYYLVLSEFAKYLALTIVILTMTVLLFTFLDIAPSMAKNNIQLRYAISYLINLSPQIIYYVSPFSILIAIVATATILSRTGQLTILLYNSSHPIWLILPVLVTTTCVFSALLFASDSILPFTNREQDYMYKKIKGKSLEEVSIAFDRQWTYTRENLIIGYRLLPGDNQTQLNALVFRLDNPNYYLSEAMYLEKIQLGFQTNLAPVLSKSASFHYQIGLDGLAKFSSLDSGKIPPEVTNREIIYEKNYHEASKLTFQQLRDYIDQVGRIGLSTISLKLELMQKLAFPFACLTLLFISLPICLLQIRRQYQSRSLAIVLSITLALIFWAMISTFEAAGKRGVIPISLAAWSPHILFLALAVTIQTKLYHS